MLGGLYGKIMSGKVRITFCCRGRGIEQERSRSDTCCETPADQAGSIIEETGKGTVSKSNKRRAPTAPASNDLRRPLRISLIRNEKPIDASTETNKMVTTWNRAGADTNCANRNR